MERSRNENFVGSGALKPDPAFAGSRGDVARAIDARLEERDVCFDDDYTRRSLSF